MAPRDESIETRMALAEERLATLRTLVEAFGPTARQVIEAAAQLDLQSRELIDMREDLKEAETRMTKTVDRVEAACSALAGKIDTTLHQRTISRATIIVGLLGLAGTLVAAVIGHLHIG